MTYEERLQNVTIIGAAGKMGSGITLLTALEIADISLKPENKDKKFVLNALDLSQSALEGLMQYLHTQVAKLADKKIEALKAVYPHLTNPENINKQYVNDVLAIVNPVSDLNIASQSYMIFEAASENPDLKVKIFSDIDKNAPQKPWYFTNTSSIPIHSLNEKANLEGRIVGFHFYNPPAVQKLVELIACNQTLPELVEFADMYAKRLRKIVVFSNDIAAFIGNGHFTRDILYAASQVAELQNQMSLPEAIYIINKISQEYMVRPMGIFQLCDYVGIDVCQKILKVMETHIKGEMLSCNLLNKMMELNIIGGQFADGSQKDGFIRYEKGKPSAIYDIDKNEYVAIADFKEKCDTLLGEMPHAKAIWKEVIASPEKQNLLEAHFNEIKQMNTLGAKLTMQYGQKCVAIGKQLVDNGVAKTEADVNTVMLTGFFHAYGPINQFFN